MLNVEFTGASILLPDGMAQAPLAISDGLIVDQSSHQVDLSGFTILPGMVDVHGDGFERHVAPRRGAMKDVGAGIRAAEAEMAANGITTGVLAQFVSWEGGLRGAAFAEQVFCAMRDAETISDLIPQMRFEMNQLDMYDDLPAKLASWQVPYLVFNDHLPHDRLADGRLPKGLNGQALRAGRSPEKQLALMQELHANAVHVPAALDILCPQLLAQGVRLGSHDDNAADQRTAWNKRGVAVAEFPETLEAAEAEGLVVLGSPNVVRGGSHKGNVSALDLVIMGYCDALASDYHYPSLRRAALFLAKTIGLPQAWALVSSGPARVLGLKDRGALLPGLRADLVVLDAQDRIAATIANGRVSYLSGAIAERFLTA